jgi:uncharacterized surface protein with fasciclin (FAS1) repeats
MKKHFKSAFYLYAKVIIGFVIGSFVFASCNNNYLENNEPSWLGASIYDYLKIDGHFTNYLKLIDDLNYKEVLAKTGSKTLFVANDSAFNEFYKKNEWGVTGYAQMTLAQKKLILNFGMINDAYLTQMLSNYYNGGLDEGGAMRKITAVSVLDSLQYENGLSLPSSSYWDNYRMKGIYVLKDNTPWATMFFTQKQLDQSQITDQDFKLLTGLTRVHNDAHVFNDKVIKRDITNKNGYLNVLQSVLIPPLNMAQFVNSNPNLTIFTKLLERFGGPYYDAANTLLYKQLHPLFADSIFSKRYFSKLGGATRYPNGQSINTDLLLPFDPGWNSYTSNSVGGALESDMAAMFVPNDNAMTQFFSSGAGAVLKDRFGSWENIPTSILPLFLKRHMRTSFIQSVPSRFSKMVDVDNSTLPVSQSDIQNVYIGKNGVVYETNKVYPPDDYNSVYGPVLLSANDASPLNKTKIWNWAIVQNDFRLYLNSMVSKYSFFVPTDEYFTKYIDPVAYAKDVPGALKYWYNTKTSSVNATVYKYNKVTGEMGDSIAVIVSASYLTNRLLDLLNMHVVVGGVETGKNFYLTKGNVAIKVSGSGTDMTVQGGGNIAMNDPVKVNRVYNQSNGYTYLINKPIQSPLSSVFTILSQKPEFSAFFALLSGFPATSNSIIFVNKTNYFGIDFNVRFFNTFNYTVYVPTNDAINQAINNGVIVPWESQGSIVGINDMTDATLKAAAILNLERFLRYHFQDNSVFLDGQPVNSIHQSATMKLDDQTTNFGTFKNKYYKIGVSGSGSDLTLTTETNKTAHVVTGAGLYNIMTRDFIFNNKLSAFKDIDGTGIGADFSTSSIYTSSTAVIHQIDAVLNFQ